MLNFKDSLKSMGRTNLGLLNKVFYQHKKIKSKDYKPEWDPKFYIGSKSFLYVLKIFKMLKNWCSSSSFFGLLLNSMTDCPVQSRSTQVVFSVSFRPWCFHRDDLLESIFDICQNGF